MGCLCSCTEPASDQESESSPLIPRVCHKIAVVGDTGSGKTSLIFRFSRGRLPTEDESASSAFEVDEMDLIRNGKEYHVVVHDTSGREEYARLRGLTYNESDVVIICFAVDRPDSLDIIVSDWVPEVRHLSAKKPFILAGMKTDLRPNRKKAPNFVTKKQGKELAKRVGAVEYFECSALLESPQEKKRIKSLFGRALREAIGDRSCCC